MHMPGFSADSVFYSRRAIARQAGSTGGGGGTIVIEGNCSCIEWKQVCIGPVGPFCLPLIGCIPSVEICFDVCTAVRCTPLIWI